MLSPAAHRAIRFVVPDGSRLVHARVNAPMATAPELYLELFDAMIDSVSFRAPQPGRSAAS